MAPLFDHSSFASERILDYVQFAVPSASENEQCSVIEITENRLYSDDHMRQTPRRLGPLDLRMGASNYHQRCETCHLSWDDCPGHFGLINLAGLPVYNWGYFKPIVRILQSVCKTCSRILLPDKLMDFALKKVLRRSNSYLEKKYLRNWIHVQCRKTRRCPHCGDLNMTVKKLGFMKIAHFKFRSLSKRDQPSLDQHLKNFEKACEVNKSFRHVISQGYELLGYMEVFEILNNIPLTDIPLLMMNVEHSHPRDLMFQNMLAAPVPVRPSINSKQSRGNTQDDITTRIDEILLVKEVFESHETPEQVTHGRCIFATSMGSWDYFQVLSTLMLNSEVTQLPSNVLKKDYSRGFAQRLKGKYGRFRGNLSGRRVNFSARTVISPDPNLRIDEVAIPVEMAKILSYKDRVTIHNIGKLKGLIKNEFHRYPSARHVVFSETNDMLTLEYANKSEILDRLKIGDIVERDLLEGDFVLFNRQPSLHRLSILCLKARITANKTLNFNECICSPFNADFDGDEMNIHLPQTEEARVEAGILMDTKANLVTPCNGQLIIGATQDFLSGCYLLTDKDVFFSRAQLCQIIQSMGGKSAQIRYIRLPIPALIRPIEMWTGKQLFSMVLRPNNESIPLNLRCGSKSYKTTKEDMDSDDNFIVIRNSRLICGQIDKSLIGSGCKQNILFYALRDGSAEYCAELMWRIARVSVAYLLHRGLSLGLADVDAPDLLMEARRQILTNGYEYVVGQNTIGKQEDAENLESQLNAKLSELRNAIGTECLKYLTKLNSPRIMALSGSKGSSINVCQMITCVGQQTISGSRIKEDKYQARCLNCFPKISKDPAAYGFIQSSFRSGLQPYEFFFHAMAGREGLVDTAVKTAETGYMQRRLVKCLEDLYCAYDCTVRSSSGDVIQFKYGADGLDPCTLETLNNHQAFDLERVYHNCRSRGFNNDHKVFMEECFMSADDVENYIKRRLSSNEFVCELSKDRLNDLRDFLRAKVEEMRIEENTHKARYELKHLTNRQIMDFFNECLKKERRCMIEPGTPVGSICAQSIGEPCTQMTLKTFHFAGVASMNITLGVPRIKELINAVKIIKTPILLLPLTEGSGVSMGYVIKSKIECVRLGQIMKSVNMRITKNDCFLVVDLDMAKIVEMGLSGLNARSVCERILDQSKKRKMKDVRLSVVAHKNDKAQIGEKHIFTVRHGYQTSNNSQITLTLYASRLSEVIVNGLESVKRAFVSEENGRIQVLGEGSGLREVLSLVDNVDRKRCRTNDVHETAKIFGIEAARMIIFEEICDTMKSHGISVDTRHVMLLTDAMTVKGEVMGMTRSGLAKMKESPLMLASFEQTLDHLYDAGYYCQKDNLIGISERIITGVPIKTGTGCVDVLYMNDDKDNNSVWEEQEPLLVESFCNV